MAHPPIKELVCGHLKELARAACADMGKVPLSVKGTVKLRKKNVEQYVFVPVYFFEISAHLFVLNLCLF